MAVKKASLPALVFFFFISASQLLGFSTPVFSPAAAESADGKSGDYAKLEKEILREMNLARTDPGQYSSFLRNFKKLYRGREIRFPGRVVAATREGAGAVDEAIGDLSARKPVPPLAYSRGLSLAARDLVREQGVSGETGHGAGEGMTAEARAGRYGKWRRKLGENISYGMDNARLIVMMLIIDDGVSDRGHRKNIFDPAYGAAGVSCGPHPSFRTVCVMDLAGAFTENK